jgi:hypothetical protein
MNDEYVIADSDFYDTQRWHDRVSLRLHNRSISAENLARAARDFLGRNRGFYLAAWNDAGEPDTFPVSETTGLFAFFKASGGRGVLHFFTADQLKDFGLYPLIDLPVLETYLAKYH